MYPFEANILQTLLRNFRFYIYDGYWWYVYLAIMGLVLSQLLCVGHLQELEDHVEKWHSCLDCGDPSGAKCAACSGI